MSLSKGNKIIVIAGRWKDVKGVIEQFVNHLGPEIFIVKLSNGMKAYGTADDVKQIIRKFKCPMCGYLGPYRRKHRNTKCPDCGYDVRFKVVDVDNDDNEVYERDRKWISLDE